MKNLIYLILIICPFTVLGQTQSGETPFITASGGIKQNSTPATYINSSAQGATPYVLFGDTIKANRAVINKRYYFSAFCDITTPAISLPTTTFTINFAGKTLSFVTNAGLISGMNNVTTTITGFIVRRPDNTMYVNFTISPQNPAINPLNLTSSNTASDIVWTGIDFTIDNPLNLTVAFGGVTLGTSSITRNYYIRSDF